MNFINDLLGFNQKPKRVTKSEMREIRSKLYPEELNDVEMLFRADLFEEGKEEGVSQAEFERGLAWLKENKEKHSLEDSDIEAVEHFFREHLND
ncbi:MAG: hypothetical protein AAGA35_00595 [Patescibacteria group bacterium]